ncbi:ATP-binding protein [Chrysiogenes arsenatis]|uniref:ATP-binding protein n=1 Tax=Chrysiogenes arsenatis TaxID=309797 RepID=UPI0003FC9264|nr:ATP-binding protein [Chrysiogenes arsenatis]
MYHRSVLYIRDSDWNHDAQALNCSLEQAGYVVHSVTYAEGYDSFLSNMQDIVVLEMHLSEEQGWDIVRKIHKTAPQAPVVILSHQGSETRLLTAIECGVSQFFPSPIEQKKLVDALNSLAEGVMHSFATSLALRTLHQERKVFWLNNTVESATGALNTIIPTLNVHCSPKVACEIRMAVFEILLNAIEHGNLGIGYQEKLDSIGSDTYHDLLRAKQQENIAKRVYFEYIFDDNQFTFIIEDSGHGFDLKSVPNPRDTENLLNFSGRGILMAFFYMDSVQYNEKGNRVTLARHADRITTIPESKG